MILKHALPTYLSTFPTYPYLPFLPTPIYIPSFKWFVICILGRIHSFTCRRSAFVCPTDCGRRKSNTCVCVCSIKRNENQSFQIYFHHLMEHYFMLSQLNQAQYIRLKIGHRICFSFCEQTFQCLQQINMKNVHPV